MYCRWVSAHRMIAVALAFLLPGQLLAEGLTLPAGTAVYGELDERVSSKKKETTVGDIVRAHVWRNVVVDGEVVIKAGAPIVTRVSMVKPAKIAGRKGDVHLEAISVRGVDDSEILLDGGYDKSGKGRKALAWSLFALVAWPLVFIKGKQAILDPGVVFDSTVQANTTVEVESTGGPFKIRVGDEAPELAAEILYDDMDPEAKQQILPVRLRSCGPPLDSVRAVTVNEKDITPIPATLQTEPEEGGCAVYRATIDLKELAKTFKKGINRFELEAGGMRTELILEIEL